MDQIGVILIAATFVYAVSHYALSGNTWLKYYLRHGTDETIAEAYSVLSRRTSTGIWLLVGSLCILLFTNRSPMSHGLATTQIMTGISWAAIACLVLIPITLFSARRPAVQQQYPEIRMSMIALNWLLLNGGSWALYLLGYEFFFRGLLLFASEKAWGLEAALAVTTCIYTLVHLQKPAIETFSCIPMGLLLGYLAWISGGFWAPWFVHLVIAVSTETKAAHLKGQILETSKSAANVTSKNQMISGP